MVSARDRDVLRRLAGETAEIAGRPLQQEKIEGWKRINALQPHRPMLWITEVPWGELEDQSDELRPLCEDEACRRIERTLRERLYTARHLRCDDVLEDAFAANPCRPVDRRAHLRGAQGHPRLLRR